MAWPRSQDAGPNPQLAVAGTEEVCGPFRLLQPPAPSLNGKASVVFGLLRFEGAIMWLLATDVSWGEAVVMVSRARLLWVALAVVVVVIGVVGVLSSRGVPTAEGPIEETPTPTPTPTAVRTPAAPVSGEKIKRGAAVTELVVPAVAGLSQALSDPSVPVELESVAGGLALADLKAEVFTLSKEGLHQVGSPKVVSAKVVSTRVAASPPTVVVHVCLDRSAVKVLDATGKDMTNPSAASRVLQVWKMASTESGWKLVDRTFTRKLTC